MHPANSVSSFNFTIRDETKKGNYYLEKKIISLLKNIEILGFVSSSTKGIYAKREQMPCSETRGWLLPTGSSLFFIFVTHTHNMLFFFSLLIRAVVPDSGWLTKEIKIELIPWGTQYPRSKSAHVASWKCNPTALASQLPDTGTKDKTVVLSLFKKGEKN